MQKLGQNAATSLLGQSHTMPHYHTSLVWLRRDLRLFDNAALHAACQQSQHVIFVFVFDTAILQDLPRVDRRVEFIHAAVSELAQEIAAHGGQLLVRHALAMEEIPRLAQQWQVDAVFANHDYEPQAIARDAQVAASLQAQGRAWHSYKDQVVYEKSEILTQAGTPYSVFTPYKNAWLKRFLQEGGVSGLPEYGLVVERFIRLDESTVPSLEALGFQASNLRQLSLPLGRQGGLSLLTEFATRIARYKDARDFPARKGPSYLSVHLRFGTVSIRELVRMAWQQQTLSTESVGAQTWLSELIWREFYQMILLQFPHVVGQCFKPAYDAIVWESGTHADELFSAWCKGETGYPLVDAAMLQLNQTGYMHNRLRMVVASFLCKDLGLDWRWGERYFAQQLNDFDLAANNGGWQWAASTGCDAQPYFRIFNPITQSEKFDADAVFIKRYLPQLAKLPSKAIHAPWLAKPMELQMAGVRLGENYPLPVVEHSAARERTLQRYAVVKG